MCLQMVVRLLEFEYREDDDHYNTNAVFSAQTLESLILASHQNFEEIFFGWPEDCRQEGYAQVLNSISMNYPNLARLG
ncbi:7774_t:CDS:2, partial [Racocetra persica]